MRAFILLFIAVSLPGCASWLYNNTETGSLQGKLIVQWIDYDKFIFLPDENEPLTFTRSNADAIAPARMYTDAGSIPRPLWGIKHYSPWGYAPAFIVHDWLFEMKHCEIEGYENYDLEIAAQVMAEVIKTLMEDPLYGGKNALVLYSMYEAVRSPMARDAWENGECDSQALKTLDAQRVEPIFQYVIEFP